MSLRALLFYLSTPLPLLSHLVQVLQVKGDGRSQAAEVVIGHGARMKEEERVCLRVLRTLLKETTHLLVVRGRFVGLHNHPVHPPVQVFVPQNGHADVLRAVLYMGGDQVSEVVSDFVHELFIHAAPSEGLFVLVFLSLSHLEFFDSRPRPPVVILVHKQLRILLFGAGAVYPRVHLDDVEPVAQRIGVDGVDFAVFAVAYAVKEVMVGQDDDLHVVSRYEGGPIGLAVAAERVLGVSRGQRLQLLHRHALVGSKLVNNYELSVRSAVGEVVGIVDHCSIAVVREEGGQGVSLSVACGAVEEVVLTLDGRFGYNH